jgi:uncharacterized protein (TIGR03435 family)
MAGRQTGGSMKVHRKAKTALQPPGTMLIGAALAFGLVFCAARLRPVNAQSNDGQALPAPQASTSAPLPSFEVVSIKPYIADPSGRMMVRMGGPQGEASRWSATNVTARNLVGTAFDVKDFQLSGGPGWINSDRFDVEAKVEDSMAAQMQKMTGREQQQQFHLLLQSMLADRFKLQVTRATKEASVFALVVAKGGPKLKEVPPPDPQAGPPPPLSVTAGAPLPTPPPGQSFMIMRDGLATLSSNAQPITSLLNSLSGMLGREVVDQTGLKGTYQYTLQFAPQTTTTGMAAGPGGGDPSPDSSVTSIFTALQEQLGLRLDTTKAPLDTITIEHIEEPSAN